MMMLAAQIIENIRMIKTVHGSKALTVFFFAVFLGVALQIQADIAGMRINMADLALPFAGLAVGASLLCKRSCWPQWNIPHAYLFLAALAGWMVVAFVNGYVYIGAISSWALYNKVLGFFVLLAYFALGGWLYTNYRDMALAPFIKGFCFFFALALVAGGIIVFIAEALITPLPRLFPYEGFMANRNAFCVLIIAAVMFMLVIERRMEHFFPVWLIRALLVFLPLVIAYNASRAGWILFIFITAYFLIAHFKWFSKKILPFLLMGGVLTGMFIYLLDTRLEKRQQLQLAAKAVKMLQQEGAAVLENVEKDNKRIRKNASELIRLRNLRDSFALWKDSPLMGAGLGALLHYQYQTYDPETTYIDIMDSSPVWLLTETGLVGFGLFMAFYIFVLRALWIKRRDAEGLEAAFAEALFVFLLAFGAMSLLHEIIYTRFLWLMMGMGVAVAAGRSKSIQNQ